MAEPFSGETRDLFEAADRAIARSRELVSQRRKMMAKCKDDRREQEVRLARLRHKRMSERRTVSPHGR